MAYINHANHNLKPLKLYQFCLLISIYNKFLGDNFGFVLIECYVTKRELMNLVKLGYIVKNERLKGYKINPIILNDLQTQSNYINERFNKPKYKAFLNK
jgi:hypothetical protein